MTADLNAARLRLESQLAFYDRLGCEKDGKPMLIAHAEDIRSLLAAPPEPPCPLPDAEIARLTALLHECNAVCLCGCPASEHESLGEDGEGCGHDDHECIRVPRSVLAHVEALRKRPSLPPGVREAAERLRQAMVIGVLYSCSNEECIDCRAHDLLVALDAPAPEVKP